MFSSYVENPTHYRFEGQDVSEKILLLLRAHPVTNLPWVITALFLFVYPFFIPTVLAFTNLNVDPVPKNYQAFLYLINYLFMGIVIFEGYLHWYFDVYIITDKNIIDIDFYSILFKNIDVAPLRNIEDTSSSMGGILSSIFNYGDVTIQTAGNSKNIELHSVQTPHKVADFILDEAHKIYGKGRDAYHHPV